MSREPSLKTASTCRSVIMSATPSITSLRWSTDAAWLITSSTLLPSRAPSRACDVMYATASGWLSFNPFFRRRSAIIPSVSSVSLSNSLGVKCIIKKI